LHIGFNRVIRYTDQIQICKTASAYLAQKFFGKTAVRIDQYRKYQYITKPVS